MSGFEAISVREDTGIAICANTFNISAEQHLDPTLLLSAEDYIHRLSLSPQDHAINNIFLYILDANKDIISNITELASMHCLNLKTISSIDRTTDTLPSVSEWLENIMNTKFIVTDSYHGIIFSIIFQKQFLVIKNPNRGLSRIHSLLSLLCLEDRLIKDPNKIEMPMLRKEINYEKIKKIIHSEKIRSMNYLTQHLKLGS
jgi:exopolysaccharide biosynthesis predicted pyruvyltransferase EpsI